ncbi:MAG: Ig-like domain-containing protein [Armatimonadota bacterium]|nr:Ig-like domain-containing protein [Armatimonadota bacterium]
MSSHPRAIVANGNSYATITAEARDPYGRVVPDGTIIEFTTTLGVIETHARTAAGVARVKLESGTTPGTAVVSAVLVDGGAVAQTRVDFLEPGTEVLEESFITVSSSSFLGYDVDRRLVDGAGGVLIYHRGLKIQAEDAQIDLKNNTIRARARVGGDPIKVERGSKSLSAMALCYDVDSMSGLFIALPDEGSRRFRFRGRDLFTEPETPSVQEHQSIEKLSFDFQPVVESKLFIRCRSMVIRPGVEIKFKRASYYIDGDRLVSVPLHVVSLRDDTSGLDQMFACGTDGVRLNLPIYYLLTPTSTGAIRIKHSESAGWGYYSDRQGWEVDVDHDYNWANSTDGRFSINRVTSGDWGIRWNQRAELGTDAQLYTYLDFPARRNLYSTVDYTRRMRDYTWTTSVRGSKLQGMGARYSTYTYLQSRCKPLVGDAVTYSVTTRLSYDSGLSGGEEKFGQGIGLQLYGKPIILGRRGFINTSANVFREWGGSNPGATLFANVSMFSNLATRGSFVLNYSYSWADTHYAYNSQRLSAQISFTPGRRWTASVYAVIGLDDDTVSVFSKIGCSLGKDWRLSLLTTRQELLYGVFSDFEIALSRTLGRQEAVLAWSQSRRRFRFEVAAATF